jgi:8-oxo-dGTP diphosphatase
VNLFVVRHAKAGDREKWTDPDELRPLTKPGRRQAEGLVDLLAGDRITKVVSSPYVRCVQTVEPLAKSRDLPVELDDALAEGARLEDVHALIERVGDGAVLCTHGDVFWDLIGDLARRGVSGADPDLMKKGATWVLEGDDAAFSRATYLPPPA